jgi:hypothetical protein
MKSRLPLGIQDFAKIREGGFITNKFLGYMERKELLYIKISKIILFMIHIMAILQSIAITYITVMFCGGLAFSQETIKSFEEDYYDLLAIQGFVERPYLNYRTLSDSLWTITDSSEHPWQGQNIGAARLFFNNNLQSLKLRIYGPEIFMSTNTATPYGQNDGALWQGKGLNAAVTGGLRLETCGVEAVFKPQFAFSQNLDFDYMQPNYLGIAYQNKAEVYGYYGLMGVDAPQRQGDELVFNYDWGDSEIRYTWKTITVGFGTQAAWLGPAQLNPLIHSNNASSYPKVDIGIRKQTLITPGIGRHLGDIEARLWWGCLSESEFFDNNISNNNNLITGLSAAYRFPGALQGLSIGVNRVMLSKWKNIEPESIFALIAPFANGAAWSPHNDHLGSLALDYILPTARVDIYFEWARNNFSTGLYDLIHYPFHSEAYTFGIKKVLPLTSRISGEILLETSNLGSFMDYKLLNNNATFYAHDVITQGYTNKGQWLGAGIGTGGNSQYLGFKLYYPIGYGQFFIQRRNPDMDYIGYMISGTNIVSNLDTTAKYTTERSIRTFLDFGITGIYRIYNLVFTGSLIFRDERNHQSNETLIHHYNFYLSLGFKYYME